MLCLLNVTDAESCLSASSRFGPFGLSHKLSESMKPQSHPSQLGPPLILLPIVSDVSISLSTVKMIAHTYGGARSPSTWWCVTHSHKHLPTVPGCGCFSSGTVPVAQSGDATHRLWPISLPRVHLQAQGRGCTFTLDGTSSSGFEGTVSSSLLDSLPSSLEAEGEWSPGTNWGPSSDGQVAGSLTRRLRIWKLTSCTSLGQPQGEIPRSNEPLTQANKWGLLFSLKPGGSPVFCKWVFFSWIKPVA